MTEILDTLIERNSWWKEKNFKINYRRRMLYDKVEKFMKYKQMISITGLRRVGKTTLLEKIVVDSLASGISPEKIVYFPFDEFRDIKLRDVLSEYSSIGKKDLRQGRYIILFDEIQKVDDWENQLKSIYDAYSTNLKIIISGSESLFIRKRSKETLSGRLFEFRLKPLSFEEYLGFIDRKYEPVELYTKELENSFDDFIHCLGFPELVGINEKEAIKKYVREGVIEKIIYRDIPELLPIKDVSILASVYNALEKEPGQLIEMRRLAGDMGIARQTLSTYLNYLEDAFLIKKLYNYSRNARKVERSLKKYYTTIQSVDLAFSNDSDSRSKMFESLVVNQLDAKFFWRDPQKHEVDIVLQNKQPLPIEVKYGKVGFEGIGAFSAKFKTKKGYIVSYRAVEAKGNVAVIPAWKALLDKDLTEEAEG